MRPFPKSGTAQVAEHGTRVPAQWDSALPVVSMPVLLGPGCIPKGCPSPQSTGGFQKAKSAPPCSATPLELPSLVPLQTWPGHGCASACPRLARPLGCPRAFLALLWHTLGPSTPHCLPWPLEPHRAPHQGHSSVEMCLKCQVLDALRGLLPAPAVGKELLLQQLSGFRKSAEVCGDFPGWEHDRERSQE